MASTVTPLCCTEKAMYKGDHRTFQLSVQDQSGAVVNLTNCILVFTVKMNPTSVESDISKSSEIPGEIDITDPTNGVAEINLVPDDTNELEVGTYCFDVQLTTAAAKVHTLLTGTMILKQDVTN